MTPLTRADVVKIVGSDPKLITAFEGIVSDLGDALAQGALNVETTARIADATVVTLSPNDEFNNERVIAAGRAIQLQDTGSQLIIRFAYDIVLMGSFKLTVAITADTTLVVPQSGTAMLEEKPRATLLEYVDDTAAAAGGIPINGMYRTASIVKVRVA